MDGIEMLQDLARIERELQAKRDEARRSAEARIAAAEDEARRILAEAEAEMQRLTESSRDRVASECADIAQAAKESAEAEAKRIREQAQPGIGRAAAFILSQVLP